jgi:glycosyltransferase involved in cell wall biosynthesis
MVLRQDPNRGKGAALRRGYEAALAAGFERVVFLDADGQHDTGAIGAFLSAADGGADLVVGTRMGDVGRMPRIRLWTNRVTSRIVSWLAGARVTDSQCGFRLATAALLRGLDLECRRYDAESEMIIKAGRRGFRIAEVPVESRYGGERSSIRPLVDTGRFLRMVWRSRRWR